MEDQKTYDLDIVVAETFAKVSAPTIHGVLWLQTHFEESEWDKIRSDTLLVSVICVDEMQQDAQEAGLKVRSRKRWFT